jgi:hypothetical protein
VDATKDNFAVAAVDNLTVAEIENKPAGHNF